MMRCVILHYHIFKNAGMSVEEMLDRNFGTRFCRFDTDERNARISNDGFLEFLRSRPALQAVSSHQLRYPVPAVPGFLFFDVCFLRDPLDRVRSMYDYAREKPVEGDPISELAARHDIGGFIELALEKMPDWICDAQVEFLSGGKSRKHLELAYQRMLQASFPGVVDCFEESLAAGEYALRQVFGLRCTTAAVNVSKGMDGTLSDRKRDLREACGARLYGELENRNALGLELVRRTREEVLRRFSLATQ